MMEYGSESKYKCTVYAPIRIITSQSPHCSEMIEKIGEGHGQGAAVISQG
jgi:hypothetical protein